MQVTLIATVFNEYGSLPAWVQGLNAQTRLPDDCVIVDGGSTDGTSEYLQAVRFPFPCRLISAPDTGIAAGRNIAISSATGDIIAVTDAGTQAEPEWLQRLVEPLEMKCDVDLVAGFFSPVGRSDWTRSLGATTLPEPDEINFQRFLASSRSLAFRRHWFEAGFCYPEWLDYCEDLIFDLQLRRAGAVQATRTDAIVRYQPRPDISSFFRQYYRYARGDGRAGLFLSRHIVRYLTYVTLIVALVRRRPLELLFMLLGAGVYLARPVSRYRRRYPRDLADWRRVPFAVPLVAMQRAVGDIAKMAGYPAGLIWRLRNDGSAKYWTSGWNARLPDGRLRRH